MRASSEDRNVELAMKSIFISKLLLPWFSYVSHSWKLGKVENPTAKEKSRCPGPIVWVPLETYILKGLSETYFVNTSGVRDHRGVVICPPWIFLPFLGLSTSLVQGLQGLLRTFIEFGDVIKQPNHNWQATPQYVLVCFAVCVCFCPAALYVIIKIWAFVSKLSRTRVVFVNRFSDNPFLPFRPHSYWSYC